MARANGIYEFPSGPFAPAIARTRINASDWEALRADIEAALTATIEVNGGVGTIWLDGVARAQFGATTALLDIIQISAGQSDINMSPHPASNAVGRVGVFRTTNTSGAKSFVLYRGDNSTTIDTLLAVGLTPTSYINAQGGFLGIGRTSPLYMLDIGGTGGVRIPKGTSAQRPTGNDGVIRYNSTLKMVELYAEGAWDPVGRIQSGFGTNSSYRWDRATGLLTQSGSSADDVSGANPLTVTFPLAYNDNYTPRVFVSCYSQGSDLDNLPLQMRVANVVGGSITPEDFQCIRSSLAGGSSTITFHWWAEGKLDPS